MKNRLELIMNSVCYGLNKWEPKRDPCKYAIKYNDIDCDYNQSGYCFNTERTTSEIILIEKRYK